MPLSAEGSSVISWPEHWPKSQENSSGLVFSNNVPEIYDKLTAK